jgi:hypothetical protein
VPAKTREIKLADADPQPIKASFDALTMAPVIPNSKPHCQAICLEGLRRNKTMNTAAALGNSTVLSPKKKPTASSFIFHPLTISPVRSAFSMTLVWAYTSNNFTFLCMHDCCLMRKHDLSQVLFFYDNPQHAYFLRKFLLSDY